MNLLSEYKNPQRFFNYFLKFKENEKWKKELFKSKSSWGLPIKFGVVGEYDNINKYEKNIQDENENYAQNGEDMFLKYIFEKINTTNKYFVEFGGWDGKFLSNTYFFRKHENWTGLLLEGDNNKVNSINNREEINLHCE